MGSIMYGHNIVMRLHIFFCTLYTIIYVRFLYPICTPYVGYMKSNFFQKRQKKGKIGQKSQNYPNFGFFVKFWFFCNFFVFFGKCKLFWKFLDFLEIFVFFGTSLLFVISEAT
jgi:hypothetical protein